MPYSAPTRSALRTSISRDIRDTTNATFAAADVDDLINMAIVELNRLSPKDYVDDVALVADTFTYTLTLVDSLFRVELWRDSAYSYQVPESDGDSSTGWDYFDGDLRLPTNMNFDDSQDALKVWGYAIRDALTDDADVADVNLEGEMLVRLYCQYTCFQRLNTSRALYQQWQTDSNNTDVSPTQLLGMANVYSREWRDARNRARRLRRSR